MQAMTREFNDDKVVGNLYHFMGSVEKEYLPHHVTLNEYLEKLETMELEGIGDDIVYKMIRRKTFAEAKVLKQWLVIVDGIELDSGYQPKNKNYLERCYNRGTEREKTRYHRAVLEAKMYLGNGLMLSIGTENIENDSQYGKKKYSEEEYQVIKEKEKTEIKEYK